MPDQSVTIQELREENFILKQRIRELEESEIDRRQTEEALQESKEKYRALIENSHDIIYSISPEGVFTYISPSCTILLGYRVTQVIGRPFQQFIHPGDAGEVEILLRQMMETGQRQNVVQYRVKHMDGSYRWYMSRGNPIRNEEGTFVGYQGITRDITEQKLAEEALRDSEERFRSLVETTSDWIWETDAQGVYTYASPNVKDILGYEPSEVLGKTPLDLMPPDEAERAAKIISQHVEATKPFVRFGNLNLHKDGRVVILETSGTPVMDENGCLTGYRGIDRDVTERRHIEEALKESETRLKSLYQESPIPTFTWQRKGDDFTLVDYNHAAIQLTGRKDGYNLGTSALEYFRNRPHILRDMELCYKEQSVVNREIVSQDFAPGKFLSMHYGFIPPDLIIINAEDITDRKRTENILQARLRLAEVSISSSLEKLMQAMADEICALVDSPIGFFHYVEAGERSTSLQAWSTYTLEKMCVTEIKGRRRDINEAGVWADCIRRHGPVIHNDYAHLPHRKGLPAGHIPVIREMVIPIIRNRKIIAIIGAGNKSKDYTQDDVLYTSQLADLAWDIIEHNRTEEKRKILEERLHRAEKMEVLGRLAGGVAHDLNNVLGILVGYSELLAEAVPDGSPLKKYAKNIQKSGMRGAAIIQDLLTLARRGVTISETVNLNQIIADYLKTPEFEKLKFDHPEVNISTDLAGQLLNIKGSPIHLSKTLMNLLSNAAEAISFSGEVTIRTKNRYLDMPIRGCDTLQEGDYAVLAVSDTGSGISANDLDKIFEPFYTSKVMGRSGTGLGLAVVWGTVKDHNGYIDVQSEEGKGTTFTLYFPITREQKTEDSKVIPPESYMGRGESILVVDDISEQLELAQSMLNRLGYRVTIVDSGEGAIALLRSNKVDLVVLDMIMDPGIDGLETYRRILEINPKQRAIIVSGFSRTEKVEKAQELGAGTYIRKPYILESLGIAVWQELDKSR